MTGRNRVFSKISLALLAATALAGCAHRHVTMTDHHMHHMAKQNARLGELVDNMNSAEGAAKVDAIAVVVNELVDRREHLHGYMHRAHWAQGCGCPACRHASEACPIGCPK
jgi:nickel-dependent lactate racemase